MEGLSRKLYLKLPAPTEADSRSSEARILSALRELGVSGYVYCYPGKSNYLGGDIISGMVATELYKKEGISVFLT